MATEPAPATNSIDQTPLAAMWRFRWLVIAITLLAGLMALLFAVGIRSTRFQATASLVVTDPRATTLFSADDAARQGADRYVADQVAILTSDSVAQRASELVTATLPSSAPDANDIAGGMSIGAARGNEILIRYAAPDEATAVATVNAVIEAYEFVRGEEAARESASAIAQLEQSIGDIDEELADIEQQILEVRTDPVRAELDSQYEDALARLTTLQPLLATASEERLEEIRAEIADIDEQLGTLARVIGIEDGNPRLSQLFAEQSQAVVRRSALAETRDQLLVDTALLSGGISLSSPAQFAREQSTAVTAITIFGGILGFIAGSGLAFLLARRRRKIVERAQPGLILRTPLLAEIPNFRHEGINTELPVLEYPGSATAEAFRFAATTLELQVGRSTEPRGTSDDRAHTFLITSAGPGDGKTVMTANLALAAARQGRSVLAVDADFGNQRLTELLNGGPYDGPGITEVAEAGLELEQVVVSLGPPGTLNLLPRGQRSTTAPDFFSLPATKALLNRLGNLYDLVLIDGPPMLHVAYASALAREVDRVVTVIQHGSPARRLGDLVQRLDLIGTPVTGYLYNAAPLRSEMTLTEGSLRDVLGDTQPTEPATGVASQDIGSRLRGSNGTG